MVSSTFSIKAIASILSIFSVANAHMIMKTPIPYGKSKINNSPLADDGSDYPCKNLFDMDDPTNDVNYLTPGVSATLSFTGSAVHGGGSCQVSLTTDLRPTKNSKWMVIKSIEGGCPANVDGNLPADPNGNGASTFQYSVPAGFPEGDYTIAWTWFNRIGNREMYMNCGRAHVGSQKKRYIASSSVPKIEHRAADYPDILRAQLQIFTCKIPEGVNVAFPDPGAAVQTVAAATTFCGGSNAAVTGGSSPGSSAVASSAAGAATTSAAGFGTTSAAGFGTTSAAGFGTARTTAVTTAPASQRTGNPGVFASGASSQAASSAQATATVEPVPVASSTPAASAVPSSGSGTGNGSSTPSTGSNAAGSACSQEGAWSCSSDGNSFQRCASGVWSAPMQMAAGTHCTPGTSMDLNMKVASPGSKRDLLSHIHKSNHHRRAVLLSS